MSKENRNSEIVRKFKDGMTLESIGTEYGVSRQRIQQILQIHGLSRESGGARMRRGTKKKSVTELHDQGMTVSEISLNTGYSQSFIAKVMKESGLRANRSARAKYGERSDLLAIALKSDNLRHMATAMGRNEHSLGAYLRRHHPDILQMISKRPTTVETDKRRESVVSMITAGKSVKEMAEALSLRLPTLQAWMKYNGLQGLLIKPK